MLDEMANAPESDEVDPSLVTYTHVIYALHAASLLIGAVGAASIVGAFLFGIPSILAVILNYVWRGDVRGTWLESHFRWQIQTFWLAFAVAAAGALLFVTIVLIPLAIGLWFGLAIWVVYRVLRGWINLREGRSVPS